MDEERVVAAAIKFQQQDYTYPAVMCGRRHADVFQQMFSLGIKYDKRSHVQGFWTNQDRFVDRYEAFDIALEAEQIIPSALECYMETRPELKGIPLFSEDVW